MIAKVIARYKMKKLQAMKVKWNKCKSKMRVIEHNLPNKNCIWSHKIEG